MSLKNNLPKMLINFYSEKNASGEIEQRNEKSGRKESSRKKLKRVVEKKQKDRAAERYKDIK